MPSSFRASYKTRALPSKSPLPVLRRWAGGLIAACIGAVPAAAQAQATPFTPGNIVVQQADNGTLQNTTITLVEISTTGASQPVQTISLPGTTTPGALRINGSGGTSGYLATTNDGALLCVTAANAQNATDLGQTTAASILTRSVVTVNSAGVYALATAGYTGTSGNQTRTSTSLDNTNWIIGDNGGIYLANAETTPSTAANSTNNVLGVSSFGGTVYLLTKAAPGIQTVNTTTGASTALPGFSVASLTGFYLISSGNSGSTYDVLYTVTANGSGTTGTISKYYLNSGTWTAKGSYTLSTYGGFGIAAKAIGSAGTYAGATLYVVGGNGANVANSVVKLTDTAQYNANISVTTGNNSVLYTFTGNNLGKGIAFVPTGPSISTVGAVSAVSTIAGTASPATNFTILASGLTGNLTVGPLTGFEFSSTSATSGFASTATLTPSSGSVAATTIYVRLAAADSQGNYSGNILMASTGATSVTMAMPSSTVASSTITLTGPLSAVSTTYGTASSPTSFSASGSGLTGNLTVTPPTGFEVSLSLGSGYGPTATLTPTSGTLASTTVYVRLTATATATGSPYSGNVSVSGGGAVMQTLAMPSSTVSPLALTISSPAVTTKPYDGTTTATITGTLSGVLAGDIGNVTLVPSGTFAVATVGTGISVTSTSTLTGTAAANYTLTQPTGLTGTIAASNNLGALTLNTGSLSSAFAFGTTSYSASVSNTASSINLTPTIGSGATVTVNGNAATSGSPSSVNLAVGANTVTIAVTEGGSTQTYTVVVTRLAPFTPGNLVIESIGNSTATTLTMYELIPGAANASQSPVQTFYVPFTGANALRQSNAGTTARLGTTNDGTLMAFTGFEDSTGILSGSPVTDETSIALRGVATLDVNYNYLLQASYTVSGTPLGDQVRTGTSVNNTTWYMDDKNGTYLAGSTSPANSTNNVVLKSFGGTIYALSQKSSNLLSTLSTNGATLTGLTGLPADANAVDFQLISSGTQGNVFDLLYVLDGTTISKYSYSVANSTWTLNGSATSIGGLTGIGMCAISTSNGAILYVTTEVSAGTSGAVLQITDTAGYGAAPSINTNNNVTLYTSSAFLKGISFVPVAAALPDVTISASSPFIAGNSFAYTLTLGNSGTVAAPGVTAQFTLPTGVTYSSYNYTGGNGFTVSASGQVVSISGGNLPANSTDTITINVTAANGSYTVDAGSAFQTGHGSVVINTSATESNTANNYQPVSVPTIVGSVPYLTVGLSGASTVLANSNYTYTVTAQNSGTASATGVSIAFTLPPGLSYVSIQDGNGDGFTGSYNAGTGVLTISGGTLAGGASDPITVTVDAATSAYRINTEYVDPGAAVITGSNFSGNNASTGSATTTVTLPSGPDLIVTSTPNAPAAGSFQVGDTADTYTLYVSNMGNAATDGSTVTVTDVFPTGLTPTAASGTGWNTVITGQTVTATRSDVVNPGAVGTAYPNYPVNVVTSYPALTVTVSVSSSGSLTNNVTVSGGGDAFTANGTASNTVNVATPSALSTTGNLLVSRAHYVGSASTIAVGQTLPNGAPATVSGAYPYVWGNEAPDVSFGVTAPIYLDVISPNPGSPISSNSVSTSYNLTSMIATQLGTNVTTSFSSKSEVGLSLTPNGQGITFMAYLAPANTLDVSNANSPYHDDPTSPLAGHGDYQHVVVQMDNYGNFQVTPVDSNSGDNTRAVVLAQAPDGNSYYYYAGSAGNSGSGVTGATMTMLAQCTGVQMVLPGAGGLSTAVGQPFGTAGNTTGYQLGYAGQPGDKTGKDMNLRAIALNPYNQTLYTAKGSGGNGVDTVYQIGSGGLPTAANANTQVFNIPSGLPTSSNGHFPFGIWFANAYTMYVADEGQAGIPSASNYSGGQYTQAIPANNPTAGLQKWINSAYDGSGTWTLAYVIQNGLNLGVPYTYTIANYATGVNSATGVPWQPANNGIRNIAGQINSNGTVTIYAVTSTISGETDQGADPNQLVVVTDSLAATSLPGGESFSVIEEASGFDCLRGVSLSMPYTPNLDVNIAATNVAPVNVDGYTASGTTLDPIALGFAPTPGQTLTLVNNTGSGPITGTFTGLPGGSTVVGTYAGNSYNFTISYTGGTNNNSIVLTAQQPVPTGVQVKAFTGYRKALPQPPQH